MGELSLERLAELRDEALADDVPLDERMTEWSAAAAADYFESGGDASVEAAAVRASETAASSEAYGRWLHASLPPLGASPRLPGENATSSSTFSATKPDARVRMLTFYGVADTVASFQKSWDALGWLEVRPIELPGHGTRASEPIRCTSARNQPFERGAVLEGLEALASQLADECGALVEDVPCIFFGFSFGALVAWAVIRELTRRGRALPLKLVVAGRGAPHCVFLSAEDLVLIHGADDDRLLEWVGAHWVPSLRLERIPQSRRARTASLCRFGALLGGVHHGLPVSEGSNEPLPHHAAQPPKIEVDVLAIGSTADALWPYSLHAHWKDATSASFRCVAVHGVEHAALMNHTSLQGEVFREVVCDVLCRVIQPP